MRSEIRAQQRAESRRRRLGVAGPLGLSLIVTACLALWSLGSPPRESVFLSTVRPTQANGGSGYLFGGASTPTSSVPTVFATPTTWGANGATSLATTPTSPPATSPRPAGIPAPTATTTSPSPTKSTTTKGKRPRPKGPPTTKG